MIYLLVSVENESIIYLPEQRECTVGRKNCDILLNDQSISRLHAKFRIKENEVTLEDCKSKYHTQHKGVDLTPLVEVKLSHKDLILFGTLNSKFHFECYQFVVTSSVLKTNAKATLKQNLAKCQGKYVEKWSNKCTHLVVNEFMLTIKVLLALIEEIPIVTPDYFTEYEKSLENGSEPPDINKFNKPPITEQLLKSDFKYQYDSRRRQLFNNKVFVFLKASSRKQMEDVIKACGGSCISWEEEPKTLEDINNSPTEHVFMKCDNDQQNESFDNMIKDLAKQNKRHIPMQEIALAIVQCSCEMNCNPKFNKASRVFAVRTQKKRTQVVLAGESQFPSQDMQSNPIKTEYVIPPTLEDEWVPDNPVESVLNNVEVPETSRGVKRVLEVSPQESVKKSKPENSTMKVKDFTGGSRQKLDVSVRPSCSSSFKEVSRQSLKRKPTESIQDETITSASDPFSSIKIPAPKRPNTNEGINPFAVFAIPKTEKDGRKPVRKNPFSDLKNLIKRPESQPIKIEEENNENEPPITLLSNRRMEENTTRNTTTTSIANVSWKSKCSISSQAVVKEEDPEMVAISKAFKDCVSVIVFEPSIQKRVISQATTLDGRKNFKKFKKIQPLHPQQVVIDARMLKKFEADPGN